MHIRSSHQYQRVHFFFGGGFPKDKVNHLLFLGGTCDVCLRPKATVHSGLKSGYRVSTCQPHHRKVVVDTWTSPRNDFCSTWCSTLLGSNISFFQCMFEDDVPFPKVGYVSSLGRIYLIIFHPNPDLALVFTSRTACLVPSDRAQREGWGTERVSCGECGRPNYLEWHHRFSHYDWSKQIDGIIFLLQKNVVNQHCLSNVPLFEEKSIVVVDALLYIHEQLKPWKRSPCTARSGQNWELSFLPCNLFNLLQINKQPIQYRYILVVIRSNSCLYQKISWIFLQVQGSRSERVGNPGSAERAAPDGAFIEAKNDENGW